MKKSPKSYFFLLSSSPPNPKANPVTATSVKNCTMTTMMYLIFFIKHIFSPKHRQTIKDSDFNEEILKLCHNFGNHLKMSAKVVSIEELKSSFHLNDTTNFCENQKEKQSIVEFQEPELFLQKSTKENLDGLSFFRSMKSFHTFGENAELRGENGNEHNFLQFSNLKELNENCFFPQASTNLKLAEQTASPIKTKFERPIILTGRSFTLDS